MDILIRVDEQTGAITVNDAPVEDVKEAMQMVMEQMSGVVGPPEEAEEMMEGEEMPVGEPDEGAMMEAFGRGTQM